jgi:hypothetical protein
LSSQFEGVAFASLNRYCDKTVSIGQYTSHTWTKLDEFPPMALLLLNENRTVCIAKIVGKKYFGRGYDCSR